MTKEERIELIKQLKYNHSIGADYVLTDEDANEIIKALEQEPCEDAISRADMLDAIGHGTTYTSEELQRVVKNLLPVTPQPKTGHWITCDPICPYCGEDKFKDLDADIWSDWRPNYCPNCGAKMVEPQKGENKE